MRLPHHTGIFFTLPVFYVQIFDNGWAIVRMSAAVLDLLRPCASPLVPMYNSLPLLDGDTYHTISLDPPNLVCLFRFPIGTAATTSTSVFSFSHHRG